MDRASGSGVFARDPDALLDLIELPVSEDLRKQEANNAVGRVCWPALSAAGKLEEVSQDALCSEKAALEACKAVLAEEGYCHVLEAAEAAKRAVEARTAWRIEGTLREFPKFAPVNLWFDYPIHRLDESGALGDVDPESEVPSWQKAVEKRRDAAKKARQSKAQEFADAVASCNTGEPPTVKDLSEYFSTEEKDVPERTIRDWVKKFGYFIDKNTGAVLKKPPKK